MILTNDMIDEMWIRFKEIGQQSLSMSHYELHAADESFSSEMWKDFLMLPDVSDWVNSELAVLQTSELNKLIQNVSKSNSVGRAQLITAINKMQGMSGNREGPVFIYTYVPLDDQQEHAPNVRRTSNDVFLT